MNRGLETELVERMVASAIVAVGTRYVVEVERELLQLRVQVLEHGSELGNVELLGKVEERLQHVNERMDGLTGEMVKVMHELRKELSRLNTGSGNNRTATHTSSKKRGRPPKSNEKETTSGDHSTPSS